MNTPTPHHTQPPGKALVPFTPPAPPPRKPFKVRRREARDTWLGFIREPMSLREAWVLAASKSRQPALASQAGRVLLFTLIVILPTWANAPLLWCSRRPTEPPATAQPGTVADDRTRLQRLAGRVTGWWGFTATATPVDEAWKESRIVHDTRIPDSSDTLGSWWLASTKTDRPLLFALLITVTPTGLNGPLLWCTLRPTRRYGLILAVLATALTVSAVAGS